MYKQTTAWEPRERQNELNEWMDGFFFFFIKLEIFTCLNEDPNLHLLISSAQVNGTKAGGKKHQNLETRSTDSSYSEAFITHSLKWCAGGSKSSEILRLLALNPRSETGAQSCLILMPLSSVWLVCKKKSTF